jgi:hypothetical protein
MRGHFDAFFRQSTHSEGQLIIILGLIGEFLALSKGDGMPVAMAQFYTHNLTLRCLNLEGMVAVPADQIIFNSHAILKGKH